MDWYSGCRIDDLVVPEDQEFSDGLPSSPGILSKWGTYAPENCVPPNKYFNTDTQSIEEEFNFNGFCNEFDIEASIQDKGHSSGSSSCAGSSEESLQRTIPSSNRPDHQLDHFAGIEQLDDLFLNSLLEDLPRNEDLHNSFGFDPESQYVLPANNLVADMSSNSKSNSIDINTRGCSKYLKSHAFSPSVGWEHEEVVASQFIPCNSEAKAPLAKLQVCSEQNIANEHVGEETSVEESVLHELKIVMTRLTDKTRICFRDALYRLAENSKQHVAASRQNGYGIPETPPGSGHDTNLSLQRLAIATNAIMKDIILMIRSGEKKATESETNVIDRAIAKLLYNKMDLNV